MTTSKASLQTPADQQSRLRSLVIPATLLAVFWTLAVVLWRLSGNSFWLLNFGWIGTAVGGGFTLFALLPRKRKVWGRRLAQLFIGSYMLLFLGLWLGENMQLEGFFFMAYSGFVAAAVIHYLVAKIVGPLLFGRSWCAWACWTAGVLDLLPFSRPAARARPLPGWGRYLSFGLSFAVVTVAWLLGVRDGGYGSTAVGWLVVGNLAYYGIAVALAFVLRDNRAFCKLLCPVAVPLKLTSPFSLMKIGGDGSQCNGCGACEKTCPMGVKVSTWLRNDTRVLSSECILCQLCVNTCARQVPRITFGFDHGRAALHAEPAPGAGRALPAVGHAAGARGA